MSKIFKYPLPDVADSITVRMPLGSRILSLQVQDGIPCLWAIVVGTDKMVDVEFKIVGTGWDFTEEFPVGDGFAWRAQYIGTVQLDELVWHYFLNARCGVGFGQ